MRAVIRVDGSAQIGAGHATRCFALAQALLAAGAEVQVVSATMDAGSVEQYENLGVGISWLTYGHTYSQGTTEASVQPVLDEDLDAQATTEVLSHLRPDWLIADNYALGATWEQIVLSCTERLMIIDDLAVQPHLCHLLLDQNFVGAPGSRYRDLVQEDCRLLLGPRWALLRDEFTRKTASLRHRDGSVRKVLVSFGATDPTRETEKALLALADVEEVESIDVVVGIGCEHASEIGQIASADSRVRIHRPAATMSDLMDSADLALGAGGSTTWERCALGLPAVVVTVADNQVETAEAMASAGATLYLGQSSEVRIDKIKEAIKRLCQHPRRVRTMGAKAHTLIGKGDGARAVAKILMDR